VNRNLVSAVEAFNLSVDGFGDADDDDYEDSLGIWNGETFVLTQTLSSGRLANWWSTAKIFWRYGFTAPLRARRLTSSVIDRFLQLYEAPHFPFRSLTDVARLVALSPDITGKTGAEYLVEKAVGALFVTEVVQASTRVNYAQNLAQIHALEAMVCLATDGAMSVEGGNWRIFDGMAKASGAHVRLSEEVTSVRRLEERGYRVVSKSSDHNTSPTGDSDGDEEGEFFDAIILAAPYHASNIDIQPPIPKAFIPQNASYVTLHVTLLTTTNLLSPAFFNLPPTAAVPRIVLTTLPDGSLYSDPQVGPASFWSISTLRTTRNPCTGDREWLYKIFSPEPMDQETLVRMFDLPHTTPEEEDGRATGQDRPKGVSWIYRKVWQSYPYLPPRTEFDSLCLDCEMDDMGCDKTDKDCGEMGVYGNDDVYGGNGAFFYTSAMEPFISTMETSSLSGMNIARLLVDDWVNDHARSLRVQKAYEYRPAGDSKAVQNVLTQDW